MDVATVAMFKTQNVAEQYSPLNCMLIVQHFVYNFAQFCKILGRGGRVQTRLSFFFSLLYGMPAPSSECQHPEAWPASTYGHLRGVQDNKKLLSGTLPDNNLFLK